MDLYQTLCLFLFLLSAALYTLGVFMALGVVISVSKGKTRGAKAFNKAAAWPWHIFWAVIERSK